jgi:hypothetical protein
MKEIRNEVRATLVKEAAEIATWGEALIALGLLPPGTDLGARLEALVVEGAGGYYDPGTRTIAFPPTNRNLDSANELVAHELAHALQDQHFDLASLVPRTWVPTKELNWDARLARRILVEGDAELSAFSYFVHAAQGSVDLTPSSKYALRSNLAPVIALSLSERRDRMESNPFAPAVYIETPHILFSWFLDPYLKGTSLALAVHDHGGWEAMDALYRDPPTSTEQILHPNERLLTSRDAPTLVTLPTFNGYEPFASDVLGELTWSTYFEIWGIRGADTVLNWDGDRFTVLRDRDGAQLVAIATVWDDPLSAGRFRVAYIDSLAKRFPGQPINVENGRHWVVQDASRVFILDGEQHLLEHLVRGATFAPGT